jgi:hypothetical protein
MNTLPVTESAIERVNSVDTWDDLITLLLVVREAKGYTAGWVINQIKAVGMPPLQHWRRLMIEFNYCFYWPNLMWVASRQTDRPDLSTILSLRVFRKVPPEVIAAEVTEVLEIVENPSPKAITPDNRTKRASKKKKTVRRRTSYKRKAPLPPGAPYDVSR